MKIDGFNRKLVDNLNLNLFVEMALFSWQKRLYNSATNRKKVMIGGLKTQIGIE